VPAQRGFRRAAFRAGVFTEGAEEALRAEPSYHAFERECSHRGINEPLPRFHDTRHAFATHALAAGLTAHAVARLALAPATPGGAEGRE
jgi:integrase